MTWECMYKQLYEFMIDHCSYTYNLSSCEIKGWKKLYDLSYMSPAHRWLDSSVGRTLHQHCRGHGFESHSGLIFFQACVCNCDDQSWIHIFLCSSNIWTFHIFICASNFVICCCLLGREPTTAKSTTEDPSLITLIHKVYQRNIQYHDQKGIM